MKAIYLARDLYMPKTMQKELSEEESNTLYKRFFKGYNALREKPEMKVAIDDIHDYRK